MIKKPIHILMVSNTASSLWNFRRDLIGHFIKSGHKVSCMATDDETSDKLREIGVDFIPINLSRAGVNPIHEFKLIKELMTKTKLINPDFVVSYTIKPNSYAPLIAKMLSVKSLAVVTGLGYAFLNNNIKARVARTVLMCGLFCANKIWFLNDEDLKTVTQNHSSLFGKSEILNGEGIDTDFFNDAHYPPPPQKPFTFLMIARILKDKGIYEFAGAAKMVKEKYPDTEFAVLGAIDNDNPAAIGKDEWDNLCAKTGLKYLGTTSDVRGVIANSHVCVLPSYREGIPRALMEGAAMRKPLIATNVAGCRDVINDGENGYLVPPYDANTLAAAMIKMYELPKDEFIKMQNTARIDIKNRFANKIIFKLYDKLLETK